MCHHSKSAIRWAPFKSWLDILKTTRNRWLKVICKNQKPYPLHVTTVFISWLHVSYTDWLGLLYKNALLEKEKNVDKTDRVAE